MTCVGDGATDVKRQNDTGQAMLEPGVDVKPATKSCHPEILRLSLIDVIQKRKTRHNSTLNHDEFAFVLE